jgi:hypothetical protein
MKHEHENIFNNNNFNPNMDINKEIVFKKKNLKSSFSIRSRKIKEKKDNISSNKTIVENTSFQIIPDKRLETSVKERKKHIKLNSAMNKMKNNFNIDNKKINEKISEIKVKKKERFIEAENKYNTNISNKYLSKLNLEPKKKEIKDSSNYIKKQTKMKKLMTITRLTKNKAKKEIQILNLSNGILINEKKNKLNETGHEKEKEMDVDNSKNIIMKDKMDKTELPLKYKKIKEIFLTDNTGKNVKLYKTKNTNNNMSKFNSTKNTMRNSSQKHNIIKRNNNNLKENKINEYYNECKIQRNREFLNYLLTKK